ncbi:MAG: META domain-containing protein, partial [Bacteroidota bacterium]
FGNYGTKTDSRLNINLGGMTKKLCEPSIQNVEDRFLSDIENVKRFQIKKDRLYLYLNDSDYLLFSKLHIIDEGGLYGEAQ